MSKIMKQYYERRIREIEEDRKDCIDLIFELTDVINGDGKLSEETCKALNKALLMNLRTYDKEIAQLKTELV